METELAEIAAERQRRESLWKSLTAAYPSGRAVPPRVISEARVARGQMGIYFDVAKTRSAVAPEGLAVSVMWTNHYGEAAPSGNHFEYSYPVTARKGSRNSTEVAAVKATLRHKLPLFFIDAVSSTKVRHIRLAWVKDWDDEEQMFLLSFEPPGDSKIALGEDADRPFELDAEAHAGKPRPAFVRLGKEEFSFRCFARYGRECAFCALRVRQMLEPVHLRAFRDKGVSDERNALVLCRSHRAALDADLVVIEPRSLKLIATSASVQLADMRITRGSISHLLKPPHPLALKWAYEKTLSDLEKKSARAAVKKRSPRRSPVMDEDRVTLTVG